MGYNDPMLRTAHAQISRLVRARPLATALVVVVSVAAPAVAVADTSHAGWPPDENTVTENGPADEAHTLVGEPNVHNYLLGKYGNDTFIGGNDGDVIWADERPTGAPKYQKAIIHAGNGKNFIYSNDTYNEVWTGTNPGTVVHAGENSGVIHCENPHVLVDSSYKARHRYKLIGCKHVSL